MQSAFVHSEDKGLDWKHSWLNCFILFLFKRNHMLRLIITVIAVGFIFSQCTPDPAEGWVEHNLIGEGIPLKVFAPKDAEIKVGTLGTMDDITIKGEDNYSVQILGMDAQTTKMETLVLDQRELVEEEEYFNAIEKEWEEGFIYSMAIDSNDLSYDFRHIRLKGDKMYVFQCGMMGQNSREVVDRLAAAVQRKKK